MHFAAIPLLSQISEFFAKILQYLNTVTGSFGWNIILLTIGFRIVVLPLTIKQTKSMIAMQRLQPQLKEIQKKYKDDREKQGQEMMKLYKENKVSPLGGCLPLLLQLPILFALFEVLRNAQKYVHYQTSFSFMGIDNLIATGKIMWSGGTITMYSTTAEKVVKQPYAGGEYAAVIILMLLTFATGYVSSKMMTNDPKQAKIMMMMPLIFVVFVWVLQAGVTLYIITMNILMVVQQFVQLEIEGFYDEKRAQRLKTGEPLKWHERWRFKFYDVNAVVLTKLRIKRPKKEEPKTAKTAVEKEGAKQAKPQAPAKKGQPPAGKKPAAKKPAGKPAGPTGGKRPDGGKPPEGKKPAEQRPPGMKKPVPKAPKDIEGTSDETGEESSPAEITRPPASKGDRSKQYPAKKQSKKK